MYRCSPHRWRSLSICLVAAAFAAEAVFSSLALAQEAPPAVPDALKYGRRIDQSSLTYCVDPRDGASSVEQEIIDAIAGALLLEPKPFVVANFAVQQELDDLYVMLLQSCDLHLGFKLLPQAYPDWMTLTRAYYEASYVLVVANPDWKSLADMPRSQRIGSTLGTSADLRLIPYLLALRAGERWQRFPMGTNEQALKALRDGVIGAALVWAPSLWAAKRANPDYADFRVVDSSPLPLTTEGVGAALLSEQTFMRTAVDEAIAALIADGTIEEILKRNEFPATARP